MGENKTKIFSNLIWRFMERIGAQSISFVVSIILARLLAPEMYGTVALITVFLAILQVFVDSGMGNALIQKKDADDTDFSTVFYFNMLMCTCLYILLFILAPQISNFYNDPSMTPIIRVIGLTLIISGLKNVQQAYVSRNMLFKKFFYATLGGTIFSGFLGILLAYFGAGVWALVAQNLINCLIDTIILWMTVKWRPKRVFSWEKFLSLFSFGWKLLCSALLDTIYNNLRNLVIGKKYSSADLAYYNQGQKIPSLVVTNINTSIGSVLFPALAKEQDNKILLKIHVRRAIQISSYIMWPILIGVAACSQSIVKILLTDKWLPCVPYLQIACVVYGFMPIHTTNLQAINAMGRSDIFLRMEILKKIIGVVILAITMPFGVLAIASSAILTVIVSTFINAYPNTILLNYSYLEQMRDILPSLLLSLFMGGIVLQLKTLPFNIFIVLIIQVVTGIFIYVLGSKLFKIESFNYLLKNIKSFKKARS